jgi:D-alanyl-D-alanine carboxypeptidase
MGGIGKVRHALRATTGAAVAVVAASLLLAEPAPAAPLDARLDNALERSLAQTRSPGVQAAIMRDGELVWSGQHGWRHRRARVGEGTLFSYASFSKLILASYTLELVERGALDLDTPIDAYVDPRVPGAGRVTPRMLLSHTGGYPELYADPRISRLFGPRYDPDRRWTYRLLFGALDDPSRPGSRFRYSNAGYIVLSYLVRELTPGPLHLGVGGFLADAGVPERLLTMRRTPEAARRIAHGYRVGRDGPADLFTGARSIPTDLYGLPWGDGMFAGTAVGAARFLDGLFVRKLLLDDARLTEMLEPSEQSLDVGDAYGLGVYPGWYRGRKWQGHDGFYGGYTTAGFTDLGRGVTIFVAANGLGGKDRTPPATTVWKALARAYGNG